MTESSQTYKEVVDITKEAVSGVLPYFEKIAEQMGTTAQYLWMLQIKQGYILAATMISKWLFLLGLFIFCIYTCNKYSGRKDAEELWAVCGFVAVILFLVLAFSFFSNVQLLLTLLFNTDYWAIQQLVLLLKGSIHF